MCRRLLIALKKSNIWNVENLLVFASIFCMKYFKLKITLMHLGFDFGVDQTCKSNVESSDSECYFERLEWINKLIFSQKNK